MIIPTLINPLRSLLNTKVQSTNIFKVASAAPRVRIPEFESDSLADLFIGIGNGMIDVLPDESFLKFCRGNITQIGEDSTDFEDHLSDKEYTSMLTSL